MRPRAGGDRRTSASNPTDSALPSGNDTKEELHTLVDQLPTDKTERALKFLRRLLQAQPDNDEVLVSGQDDPMRQLIA